MKKIISSLILLTTVFSLVFVFTSCIYGFNAFNVFGIYDCKTCHDQRVVVCGDCDGKKQRPCLLCGGDGLAPCTLCSGIGSRTCLSCGGTGGRVEYDFFSKMYMYKTCYSCVGGRVSCPMTSFCSCSAGKVDCTTCGAQGRMPCPDCPSDASGTP